MDGDVREVYTEFCNVIWQRFLPPCPGWRWPSGFWPRPNPNTAGRWWYRDFFTDIFFLIHRDWERKQWPNKQMNYSFCLLFQRWLLFVVSMCKFEQPLMVMGLMGSGGEFPFSQPITKGSANSRSNSSVSSHLRSNVEFEQGFYETQVVSLLIKNLVGQTSHHPATYFFLFW